MKLSLILSILVILVVSITCQDNEQIINGDSNNKLGKISMSISQAPPEISLVIARLSRRGFDDRLLLLSISDTGRSASGTFTNVAVGTWHLRVDAQDSSNVVRYSGETDVEVFPGQTTQIELELLPTSGNIEIHVTWGSIGNIVFPDNSKWEWTRDSRGGGSQGSLINHDGLIEILPVGHIHFVNRSVLAGQATYKFKFKGTNFKFAWRISPYDSSRGTALILQKAPGAKFALIHVEWWGFYYGWHNASSFFNLLDIQIDSTVWHSVEIRDLGNDLKIFYDGTELNFFDNQIPVSKFLSGVSSGYIGIGGEQYQAVSYKDFQIILH